jgi:hypothetical protein
MEELHVSADDLAIAAAKERLAGIVDRPGYREAMRPRPRGSRKAVVILELVGLAMFGLGLGSCTAVSATWLRLIMSTVFVVLGLGSWFLAIGASPRRTPAAWPVAVLGKPPDPDPAAAPQHKLTLLRDDGSTVTVTAGDALHAILRAGDAGVAHVAVGESPELIAFHRL